MDDILGGNSGSLKSMMNYIINNTFLLNEDGIQIPMGCDINTIFEVGNYYCRLDTIAETLINCPIQSAFILKVFLPTGDFNYRTQLLIRYNKTEIYSRMELSNKNQFTTQFSRII